MIPAAEAVAAAYEFVARRYGIPRRPDIELIRDALDEARSLIAAESDEPAAMFFALVRRPAALPGLHAALVEQLVLNHATALGLAFDPTGLRTLHVPVALGRMDFTAVREWFAARLGSSSAP